MWKSTDKLFCLVVGVLNWIVGMERAKMKAKSLLPMEKPCVQMSTLRYTLFQTSVFCTKIQSFHQKFNLWTKETEKLSVHDREIIYIL